MTEDPKVAELRVTAKWQPVTDTIPSILRDDGDKRPNYVLVFNGHHVGVGYREVPNYEGDPEWSDETGVFIEPPVTHWQPLPLAPSSSPTATMEPT
jgi:hypothetical protein